MLRRSFALACILCCGLAQAQSLPLSACAQPVYSAEAKRYEMQGTTSLAFSVGTDGKSAGVTVARSSGWKLLDAASVELAASCRFAQPAAAASLDVPWVLPPDSAAPVPPVLVAASCKASTLFKPADAPAGLRVRLQVWADGQIYAPRIETGSGNEQVDRAALAMVQTCRYSPAERAGVPVQSAAVMHLAFERDKLEEPALRALYQRYLPLQQRRVAGKKEYRSAHILVKTEQAAREVHARIAAGEPFAQAAARASIDRAGKDGGDLGWALPESYTPAFADALRGATAEGLLAQVVKSPFGWHIIRIDGIRAAEPLPFEQVKDSLWQAVLSERNLDPAPGAAAPARN